MKFLHKYWFSGLTIFFVLVITIIFIWNGAHYTTHWAYDGGAHIDYIFTIAKKNLLPDQEANYLAWHEPLYYGVNAIVVKLFLKFDFSQGLIVEIIEYESAILALLFIIGSAILAFKASNSRNVSFFVLILTGSLFIVSALARYITNEMLFHALAIWWMILFWHWKMYDLNKWKAKKWFVLFLGLTVLIWVKLSGLIIAFAIIAWMAVLAMQRQGYKPVLVSVLLVCWVAASYSPWLMYKHSKYGELLTINNFEETTEERMPISFYASWDNDLFKFPFWESGKKSFWTMLYASALGDYDNIFQNYESKESKDEKNLIRTDNGRWLAKTSLTKTLIVYWWSVPLFIIIIIGNILYLYQLARDRFKRNDIIIAVIAYGFLFGLMYNTYIYPALERGTLKSLFILTSFPLFILLASKGWCLFNRYIQKRPILAAACLYIASWVIVSLYSIILPA